MARLLDASARAASFCWLTTTGRQTGRPREVELWFGAEGDTVYFLAGGGESTHWVRNIDHDPQVHVRLGRTTYAGTGRRVTDAAEESVARRLLASKYQGWEEGRPLSSWARTALPLAIDLAN
jgi:deazaflavin-dependent oxidoreductase (nitroreductase family)